MTSETSAVALLGKLVSPDFVMLVDLLLTRFHSSNGKYRPVGRGSTNDRH